MDAPAHAVSTIAVTNQITSFYKCSNPSTTTKFDSGQWSSCALHLDSIQRTDASFEIDLGQQYCQSSHQTHVPDATRRPTCATLNGPLICSSTSTNWHNEPPRQPSRHSVGDWRRWVHFMPYFLQRGSPADAQHGVHSKLISARCSRAVDPFTSLGVATFLTSAFPGLLTFLVFWRYERWPDSNLGRAWRRRKRAHDMCSVSFILQPQGRWLEGKSSRRAWRSLCFARSRCTRMPTDKGTHRAHLHDMPARHEETFLIGDVFGRIALLAHHSFSIFPQLGGAS
ncbi:uncharacterized protein J3D65DRAFT_418252 [Phyllosticta citribraziliensis]|uniref:Uncharacterized protein n=1 Tax=Phyllosticta citribraziliensis TaxID=989973 RepID=A0ABR1LPI5_9PEZI